MKREKRLRTRWDSYRISSSNTNSKSPNSPRGTSNYTIRLNLLKCNSDATSSLMSTFSMISPLSMKHKSSSSSPNSPSNTIDAQNSITNTLNSTQPLPRNPINSNSSKKNSHWKKSNSTDSKNWANKTRTKWSSKSTVSMIESDNYKLSSKPNLLN